MSDTFDTIDRWPIRYGRNGVLHAVEGSEVHPGITLLWPKCGAFDIPSGKAFKSSARVTCPKCQKVERTKKSGVPS